MKLEWLMWNTTLRTINIITYYYKKPLYPYCLQMEVEFGHGVTCDIYDEFGQASLEIAFLRLLMLLLLIYSSNLLFKLGQTHFMPT